MNREVEIANEWGLATFNRGMPSKGIEDIHWLTRVAHQARLIAEDPHWTGADAIRQLLSEVLEEG